MASLFLTGEWQHDRKKAIKIKKHGRLSVSLFRYGLDYVQMAILRLIGFGKKEEFKKVLAILRKKKSDRTRALWNLSCTESPDLNLIEKMWSRVKMIRNKFRVKDIDKLFKDYCYDLFSI